MDSHNVLVVLVHIISSVVWALVFDPTLETKGEKRFSVRTVELANQRKEELEEAERFYASPEWKALHKSIILEQGNKCGECGSLIRQRLDITVDYVLPRSKYPNLALTRSNLRLLCRRCNSRKGVLIG